MAVLFAGFSYIRRAPIILGAISLDLFAVLFGGAVALLPAAWVALEVAKTCGPDDLVVVLRWIDKSAFSGTIERIMAALVR